MWPSWEQTLIISATALLEGAVGFDFGLLAVPAMGALLGVRDSVILLSLPNLAIASSKVLGRKMPSESLLRMMPFIGAGGVGAAVGVLTLLSAPPIALKWGVGTFVLICAAYSISRLRFQFDPRDETFFAYLAGLISGWLGGVAYAGGPIAVMYLDSLRMNRTRLVRLMNVSALAFAAVQVAALSGSGNLLPSMAMRAALAVFPALAGFLIGRRIRGMFSPEIGYTVGLGLMIAAALSLLIFGQDGWK
ncbi:MAG: sulfite exporter TauE/SafE family protein [Nitrospinota bacterium]